MIMKGQQLIRAVSLQRKSGVRGDRWAPGNEGFLGNFVESTCSLKVRIIVILFDH